MQTHKQCSCCKELKEVTDFSPRRVKGSDKVYLASRCKPCQNIANANSKAKRFANKADYNAHQVQWRTTDTGRLSWAKTKAKRLGLPATEVGKVILAFKHSDGSCNLCGKHPQHKGNSHGLYIDHCHEKMVFRGLLCSQCNSMLGHAHDDTEILQKAVGYLLNQNCVLPTRSAPENIRRKICA